MVANTSCITQLHIVNGSEAASGKKTNRMHKSKDPRLEQISKDSFGFSKLNKSITFSGNENI